MHGCNRTEFDLSARLHTFRTWATGGVAALVVTDTDADADEDADTDEVTDTESDTAADKAAGTGTDAGPKPRSVRSSDKGRAGCCRFFVALVAGLGADTKAGTGVVNEEPLNWTTTGASCLWELFRRAKC